MSNETEEIICRTTPWYKKRRLLMVAMLLGFSAYFFYDWKIGYPKQKEEYDQYWPVYQELSVKAKDEKAWLAKAKDNDWPESPKEKDWDYKLKEQFIWGVGTGIIGLGLLVAYLRNKNRVLRADADSLITPEGVRIPFASVTRIDKRKWDNKALAYLIWNDGPTPRKAVIDDLVFDGAGKVLDRLLANFHGELIDLEREPQTAAAETAEEKADPPASTNSPS
jgi:hypothetical protein